MNRVDWCYRSLSDPATSLNAQAKASVRVSQFLSPHAVGNTPATTPLMCTNRGREQMQIFAVQLPIPGRHASVSTRVPTPLSSTLKTLGPAAILANAPYALPSFFFSLSLAKSRSRAAATAANLFYSRRGRRLLFSFFVNICSTHNQSIDGKISENTPLCLYIYILSRWVFCYKLAAAAATALRTIDETNL